MLTRRTVMVSALASAVMPPGTAKAADEPQTAASGMLLAAPHPRLPDYRAVGLPLRWDRQRPGVRRVPPLLGEHSADVLTWLGYTLDDVRNLQTQGVVQ